LIDYDASHDRLGVPTQLRWDDYSIVYYVMWWPYSL